MNKVYEQITLILTQLVLEDINPNDPRLNGKSKPKPKLTPEPIPELTPKSKSKSKSKPKSKPKSWGAGFTKEGDITGPEEEEK